MGFYVEVSQMKSNNLFYFSAISFQWKNSIETYYNQWRCNF